MAKPKEQSAAIVTIKEPHLMTLKGRRAIATWLRQQAEWLEDYGNHLGKRFIARYRIKHD